MANEPTIEIMNEAIALFMGYKKREKLYRTDRQILEGENLPNWYEDSLKYHTSWDWLMPVVEKIRKGVSLREFDIGYTLFYENTSASALFHLYIYASIETVYDAVYQFITWLNQQKQKDA